MKRILYLSMIVFFVHYKSYGEESSITHVKENPIQIEVTSTSKAFNLNENEKSKLNIKSESGDSSASYRLHQYYTYTCFNVDKQIKYLSRAASQGDVIAQYNYGIILSSIDSDKYYKYYNLEKAIYWMKLAAAHGHDKAKNELSRLEGLKRAGG